MKNIENISIKENFHDVDGTIEGTIKVTEENVTLDFDVKIFSSYPFQISDRESIQFFNNELKDYNHVNYDGSICIHNYKNPDLKVKLNYDLISLKQWIKKYYIDKTSDNHYEHIIVNEQEIEKNKFTFLFTNVEHKFTQGEMGVFCYSHLRTNLLANDIYINTYLVQGFTIEENFFKCGWSNVYLNSNLSDGIFIYIENPPVIKRRFIVENWMDLKDYVNQDFFNLLKEFEKRARIEKEKFPMVPILIGYKITESENHWQVAIILHNRFPHYHRNYLFSDQFEGKFKDLIIHWGQTKNISYKYFFGRGKLNSNFTDSNIAIIGIGAIGSIVAKTLVRGGCKKLLLIDYDLKEPENVCRSEYSFSSGIIKKVNDLATELQSISPFVDIILNEFVLEIAKTAITKKEWFDVFIRYFSEYDIVIDTTADNDVAYLLDNALIKSQLINLSITNHAKELVCVTQPNLYEWLLNIFQRLSLDSDIQELYNPTGCWSPTFKASYNDINVMVQFALRQINACFENNIPLRNFYLSSSYDSKFNIQIKQF